MAKFKITDPKKVRSKAKSFRLPEELLEAMGRIAKKNKVSVNKLAKQMLQHCVEEYEKGK